VAQGQTSRYYVVDFGQELVECSFRHGLGCYLKTRASRLHVVISFAYLKLQNCRYGNFGQVQQVELSIQNALGREEYIEVCCVQLTVT